MSINDDDDISRTTRVSQYQNVSILDFIGAKDDGKSRRLKLFGHIAGAEPAQDHARALRASSSRLPEDWRRPRGRPCQSWLRTVEADLKPNFGFHRACQRAADRSAWRSVVETAMLFDGCATP